MKRRNRSYSKPAGDSWSAVTVPATPSMSTEMYTFNFPAGVPPFADPREATPNNARHNTSVSTDAAWEIRRSIFPPRKNGDFRRGSVSVRSSVRGRKREGNIAGGQYRVHVDAHGVFDAACVPSRQRSRDGNTATAGLFEHFAVAFDQTPFRERQAAELILTKRIGSADVENNVRLKIVERFLHRGNQFA